MRQRYGVRQACNRPRPIKLCQHAHVRARSDNRAHAVHVEFSTRQHPQSTGEPLHADPCASPYRSRVLRRAARHLRRQWTDHAVHDDQRRHQCQRSTRRTRSTGKCSCANQGFEYGQRHRRGDVDQDDRHRDGRAVRVGSRYNSASSKLYTANQGGNSVTVINIATNAVITTVARARQHRCMLESTRERQGSTRAERGGPGVDHRRHGEHADHLRWRSETNPTACASTGRPAGVRHQQTMRIP